jgi:hypothetical protein
VVSRRVHGSRQQSRGLQVKLPAGHADGFEGGGAGKLDGQDSIVLAGGVRSEELAAEDDAN